MRKLFKRLTSVLLMMLLSLQFAFNVIGSPTLTLSGLDPVDGSVVSSLTPTFTMNFQDEIFPGIGGTIGLYTATNVPLKVIQVAGNVTDVINGKVVFSDKTITISFKNVAFTEKENYYLLIEGNAIKDRTGISMNTLTSFNGDNKWNFSMGDFTSPKISLIDPKDEETGVTVSKTCSISFNEPISFIPGYVQNLGDFAIYKDISEYDNEEGGDLVSLQKPIININNNILTIDWISNLEPSTKYYVRIKGDIIQDISGNKFSGINNNTYWNFSTKISENIIPVITAGPTLNTIHNSNDVWTNDNFFIDFSENMYVSKDVQVSNDNSLLRNLSLNNITLTDENEIDIPFNLSWDPITFTFKLDPINNLIGKKFTIKIKSNTIYDVDNNANNELSVVYNSGDWISPEIINGYPKIVNENGTGFDILVKANEKCTIKYIVVKGNNNPQPMISDVIGYSTLGTSSTYINPTTYVHRTINGDYQRITNSNVITCDIVDEGFINVNDPTLEVLKRVVNLPATNGQDYEVYMIAYDNSLTGVYNPNYSNPDSQLPILGNISNVKKSNSLTHDILMPTVWFDGDSIGFNSLLNKNKQNGTLSILNNLSKKGKIYLNFNEPIRLNNGSNGSEINNNSIESFVVLRNNGINVGYSSVITDDKKTIVIVPDSSYKSNSIVDVEILPTKIEDYNGNEFQPQLDLRNQYFMVENYISVLSLFEPINNEQDSVKCVNIKFNDNIYVPTNFETSNNKMIRLISEPNTSLYWVGNFIDIREGDINNASSSSRLINDDFSFNIQYTDFETSINVCRKSGNWKSETWYYVDVNPYIIDNNRYELFYGNGISGNNRPTDEFNKITTNNNDNRSILFKYADIQPAEVVFFSENQSVIPTNIVNINDKLNILPTDRIGVYIKDWSKLKISNIINNISLDGNALRSYFKLTNNGNNIEFDIRNVQILGDDLYLYIDPYYNIDNKYTENPNFSNNQSYNVKFTDKFISNATFTCTINTLPSVNVTYSPNSENLAPLNSDIVFTFDQYHTPSPLLIASPIQIDVTIIGALSSIDGTISNDYKSATYILPQLSESVKYQVFVPANTFTFNNGSKWPASDSTWYFTTVDLTGPSISLLTPIDNNNNFSIDDDIYIDFNENINIVSGKKLLIIENGVIEVVRIDASQVTVVGDDSIKIPNNIIKPYLKYNTNYHILIDNGFVTDNFGNKFNGISDKTVWNFKTSLNPAPSYASFSPTKEVLDINTDLVITFTEPVKAINNKFIKIYDVTSGIPELVESLEVDEDIRPTIGFNTQYVIDADPIDFQWRHMYQIEIESGSFVDTDNNSIYSCVLGGVTNVGNRNGVSANWEIIFSDITVPTVKFWPEKPDTTHIPYNAYLYLQFSEPILISNGNAIISDPSLFNENISSFITLSSNSTNIPTRIEFIDNEKRILRVTPLDPQGYNYSGSLNPTMQTETLYKLTINNNSGIYTLVDSMYNAFKSSSVSFLTEDITKPIISVNSVSDVDGNSAKVNLTINEPGKVYVYIIPGVPTTSPSVSDIKNNAQWIKTYENNIYPLNITTSDILLDESVGSKTYTIYAVADDDEIDVYRNPNPSLWIFTETNEISVDRIRDILPSPNTSLITNPLTFNTCDDDVPFITKTSPSNLITSVKVDEFIYLVFNENIIYNNTTDGLIKLRNKDNIVVNSNITVVNGDSIKIDPINNLDEESSYYVEIDRYAITDMSNCSSNRFNEWIGKDYLYFTTIDNESPTIDSANIVNNEICVDNNINSILLYVNDINTVFKNGGDNRSVKIYRGTISGTLLEVIDIQDSRILVNNNIVYIDVSNFIFSPKETYTIIVDSGSIKDVDGNVMIDDYVITFTTIDNIPPVITWNLYEWNYNFNYSADVEVGLNKFLLKNNGILNGLSYEIYENAPSNSILEIKFDKDIDINTSSTKWLSLSNYNEFALPNYEGSNNDNILSKYEIFKVLKIGNLKYDQVTIYDVTSNSILIGFDTIQSLLYNEAKLDSNKSILDLVYSGSLLSNETYNVTIEKGKISGPLNCVGNRIVNIDTNVVVLKTRNDLPPTLNINVCDNVCNNDSSEIILTFDKPIVKSSYDISWLNEESLTADNLMLTIDDIYSGNYLKLIKVDDNSIVDLDNVYVVDNKTIKFKSKLNFDNNTDYKIIFNKWTVKEYLLNDPSGTLFEGVICEFHVYDNVSPKVVKFEPLDNSNNISSDINSISVTFDEKIKITNGYVDIKRENGTIFEHVDITKCVLDNNKTKLTIPFIEHNSLEDFTLYYVTMSDDVLTDTVDCSNSGNKFEGFSAFINSKLDFVADWNFKTSDATPPELLSDIDNNLIGLYPEPGDSTVPKNTNLVLMFDENIDIISNSNSGIVIYYDNGLNPNSDFGNAIEFIPWNSELITISGSDVYNDKTSDIITINPLTIFDKLGTYYIRVNGENVRDLPGSLSNYNLWSNSTNTLLNEIKDEEWKFTITNDVVPVLVSTTPEYDFINNIYTTLESNNTEKIITSLDMTFEDELGNPLRVSRGDESKKIFIYTQNNVLWKEYSITDTSITFDNNVVTINDVELLSGINDDNYYYIIVEQGAIRNGYVGSETYWNGISNSLRWRFKTENDSLFIDGYDIISPNIVEHNENAMNLNVTDVDSLIISFNEDIVSIDNPVGRVQLISNDSIYEYIVTSDMCNDNTLIIPTQDLVDENNYTVLIQSGSFSDKFSNVNFEIGGTGVWEFTTGDYTIPMPISYLPINCAKNNEILSLTFNESYGIIKGSGEIEIIGDNYNVKKSINDAIIINNTLVISLYDLPDTTTFTVNVPAGFVVENTDLKLSNTEFSWQFKTGDNTKPFVVDVEPIKAFTKDTILTLTFNEPVNKVDGKFISINDIKYNVNEFTTIDSINYVIPLNDLISQTTYNIIIDEGAFIDINECVNNEIVETNLLFEVSNLTLPIVYGSPIESDDYYDLEIALNFNDNVIPSDGNVIIYDYDSDVIIETITASKFISYNDSIYTYKPENLKYGKYYIIVENNAFVSNDSENRYCSGILDKSWILTISDNIFNQCINIIYPKRAETDVPLNTTIVIDFCDERIVPGTKDNRYLTISEQSDERVENVNYFNYTIEESMIDNNKLSVDISGLHENTTYSIIIATGAISDESGNDFPGMSDANYWIFTTGDFTIPTVNVDNVTVLNDENSFVNITGDESGDIYLVMSDVDVNKIAFNQSLNENKGVKILLSESGDVSVCTEGLLPGSYKAYLIDKSGKIGVSENIVTIKSAILPLIKISEVQGMLDESSLKGQEVRINGVVTAIDNNGFYIQDENVIWSGIYVYGKEYVNQVVINNSVEVVGIVDEYNGLTEIKASVVNIIVKLFDVVSIDVNESESLNEKYEGLLVTVIGRANESYNGNSDWTIKSDDEFINISNYIYGTYESFKDYKYSVTGVVYSKSGVFKVEPRIENDIINLSKLNNNDELVKLIKIIPNPFDSYIEIKSDINIKNIIITSISGQVVKNIINFNNTIRTDDLYKGVYFISLYDENGIIKTEKLIKR